MHYFYRCGVFENYSYFYCSINFTELNVVLLPHHADVVCLDGIVDACRGVAIKSGLGGRRAEKFFLHVPPNFGILGGPNDLSLYGPKDV